jgi:AcrR family transcriptional regulator
MYMPLMVDLLRILKEAAEHLLLLACACRAPPFPRDPVQLGTDATGAMMTASAATAPVSTAPVNSARMTAEPASEVLRADALHNRQRILDAAQDAFASSAEASLNSIAKKAGVGPGTLYRHFPTRAALLLAVYGSDVQKLADTAAELLAAHPPRKALRLWLDRLARYSVNRHGLADALHAATSDDLAADSFRPVVDAIAALLAACNHHGNKRAGTDPDDVLLLLGCLWRIDPGPDADARADRLLDLIMDGLHGSPPASALPAGHKARRPARLRGWLGRSRA